MKHHLSLLLTYILLTATSLSAEPKEYRYYLGALAIFRNDAPYLKEWIEYHKLVGIEHFYLYNNLSNDGHIEVLQPYIDNGYVELIDWPYEHGKDGHWTKIQRNAYRHAIEGCSSETKWLAIIDTDEFIVPGEHKSLNELIASEEAKKQNKNVARYEISWILFGTSGVERTPNNRLMIELLLKNEGKANKMYKSIVRPQYVGDYINPHKTNLTKKMKHKKLPLSTAQVNHYVLRDQYFLHKVKIPRVGNYYKSTEYLLNLDKQCCHINRFSDKILRFAPQLSENMGFTTVDNH
ncbi:MAG: glycosyltransferase family 92 protein [Chlamydiota bacterium]